MAPTTGLIVLDAVRYDAFVDEMTAVYEAAPRRYDRMYSTSRWTPPAHASLFTGYYPTEVGVHTGNRRLDTPKPVLAEQLRSLGLETVGLSNNVNVDSFFGFDRGFDAFHRGPDLAGRPSRNHSDFDWTDLEAKIPESGLRRPLAALRHILEADGGSLPTLRDGLELFLANGHSGDEIEWALDVVDDLADESDGLFLFANLMAAHYPYEPPAEYSPSDPLSVTPMELTLRERPVTDPEHRRHHRNYRGAVRYLERGVSAIVDAIDWDVLFVLSDHGELFGEHGLRGHQYGVYEDLVHVPAVAFGDLVEPGETERVTSLVDVHRTLLEVAGGEADDAHRGLNLLETMPPIDRAVYAESTGCEWYSPDASGIEARVPAAWNDAHYAVRTRDLTFVHDKDGDRTLDPGSGEVIAEGRSALADRAEQIRQNRQAFGGTSAARDLSGEAQQRLRRLGYR